MTNSTLQGQGFFAEDYLDFKSFCGDSNVTQEEICSEIKANKFKHSIKIELKPSEQELMKDKNSLSKALIVRAGANFLLSYEDLFRLESERDEIAAKAQLSALYDALLKQYGDDDIFEQMLKTDVPEEELVVVVSGANEHHVPHGYSSHCFIG